MNKKPNSHECAYFGRRLSNVCVTDDCRVAIGSDRDDEIYYRMEGFDPKEPTLKERVQIYAGLDDDYKIDLEDLLRFAAIHCTGIYDRVRAEVEPIKFEGEIIEPN